jgi:hypothetical protein
VVAARTRGVSRSIEDGGKNVNHFNFKTPSILIILILVLKISIHKICRHNLTHQIPSAMSAQSYALWNLQNTCIGHRIIDMQVSSSTTKCFTTENYGYREDKRGIFPIFSMARAKSEFHQQTLFSDHARLCIL